MSKELEALNIISRYGIGYSHLKHDILTIKDVLPHEIDIIEKSLKALEIIKNYVIDIGVLIDSNSYGEYNHRLCQRYSADFQDFHNEPNYKGIGQEEYEILKEVLQCQHTK